MVISLDSAIEQRIQRQLKRGVFTETGELLAHALDLLEAEEAEEDWLLQNKQKIRHDLKRTFAQAANGESYSPEESLERLAQRRAARAA